VDSIDLYGNIHEMPSVQFQVQVLWSFQEQTALPSCAKRDLGVARMSNSLACWQEPRGLRELYLAQRVPRLFHPLAATTVTPSSHPLF